MRWIIPCLLRRASVDVVAAVVVAVRARLAQRCFLLGRLVLVVGCHHHHHHRGAVACCFVSQQKSVVFDPRPCAVGQNKNAFYFFVAFITLCITITHYHILFLHNNYNKDESLCIAWWCIIIRLLIYCWRTGDITYFFCFSHASFFGVSGEEKPAIKTPII